MESQQQRKRYSEGRLPEMAPLANPYVPFQMENPPKYESGLALVRGTLFPGLDLPFMNLVNNKEFQLNPKTELQTLSFMIQELALYLDTHPDDRAALEAYQAQQKRYSELAKEYGEHIGQLNHGQPTEGQRYRWLDDPWPWEFAANQEV